MKFKTFYKYFSVIVGIGAILTLVYGLFIGQVFGVVFKLHDPVSLIAWTEIVLGLSTIPFYIKQARRILNE